MEYLVSLAVSEGLHEAVDALGPSLPVVKKPRLDPGAQTPSPNVVLDAFVGLLDYSLLESIEVLGKLGEQLENSSQDPVAEWLDMLSNTLGRPMGEARRG